MEKIIDKFNAGVDFRTLYNTAPKLEFIVLWALEGHRGHENRISQEDLTTTVNWHLQRWNVAPGKVTPRKVRDIVKDLRRAGALIVSTGGIKGGYWITEDFDEGWVFTEKELEARAMDLLETMGAMRKALQREFGGQRKMNL